MIIELRKVVFWTLCSCSYPAAFLKPFYLEEILTYLSHFILFVISRKKLHSSFSSQLVQFVHDYHVNICILVAPKCKLMILMYIFDSVETSIRSVHVYACLDKGGIPDERQ